MPALMELAYLFSIPLAHGEPARFLGLTIAVGGCSPRVWGSWHCGFVISTSYEERELRSSSLCKHCNLPDIDSWL
jgi:hypothetical protein